MVLTNLCHVHFRKLFSIEQNNKEYSPFYSKNNKRFELIAFYRLCPSYVLKRTSALNVDDIKTMEKAHRDDKFRCHRPQPEARTIISLVFIKVLLHTFRPIIKKM